VIFDAQRSIKALENMKKGYNLMIKKHPETAAAGKSKEQLDRVEKRLAPLKPGS